MTQKKKWYEQQIEPSDIPFWIDPIVRLEDALVIKTNEKVSDYERTFILKKGFLPKHLGESFIDTSIILWANEVCEKYKENFK